MKQALKLYPDMFGFELMRVVRFYDPDDNLIEVGTLV